MQKVPVGNKVDMEDTYRHSLVQGVDILIIEVGELELHLSQVKARVILWHKYLYVYIVGDNIVENVEN